MLTGNVLMEDTLLLLCETGELTYFKETCILRLISLVTLFEFDDNQNIFSYRYHKNVYFILFYLFIQSAYILTDK